MLVCYSRLTDTALVYSNLLSRVIIAFVSDHVQCGPGTRQESLVSQGKQKVILIYF